MNDMVTFDVEFTDTFGGDANYSWVRRAQISVPHGCTHTLLMRRAKASVGLTGVRGIQSWCGDSLEFRPHRSCTVMFVTYHDE